jgi:hypothetical protein
MIPFDERPSDSAKIARMERQMQRIQHQLAKLERQLSCSSHFNQSEDK